MVQDNDFDVFIGLILARLYEARPKRLDFEASDFIDPTEPDGSYDGERIENWCNTMFWLNEEGYIREGGTFTGNVSYHFADVALTEKGFRALNSLPSHLKGLSADKSFGTQLIDLGKKTGWKAAAKAVDTGSDQASKQAAHAIGELIKGWFT